jgi:rare lipoprotein A (peptidoglycan hydrolase)
VRVRGTTFRRGQATAIRAGLMCGVLVTGCTVWVASAHAKLPGIVHCYNDICHRVRTVDETHARRGVIEPVVASFYDSPANDRFNPRLETSSGAMFDADTADNAASPIHPDGTVLLIWSPVTRGAAVVRVNNAGPYYPGRTLDVSRGTAEKLGFAKGGVMQLLSVVIAAPSEPDARYQRGRVYPKVRGYLGTFENLALASLEDPTAREAVFQGNQPLAALALNTTQHLMLAATEKHMKSHALAEAFATVPNELVEPPDLHSSMVVAESEMVPPEAAVHTPPAEAATAGTMVRVITISAAQAGLTTFASMPSTAAPVETIKATVLKAKAIAERSEGFARPRLAVRRSVEETGVPPDHVARVWIEGETQLSR